MKHFPLLFLAISILFSCNRALIKEREVFIQKDSTIITSSLTIDTVINKLTDTLTKKNIVVAYSFDTIKKRSKIYVRVPPETLKVRKTFIQKETFIKEQNQAQTKQKRPSLWFVGFFSGIISGAFLLILGFFKNAVKRFFTNFV